MCFFSAQFVSVPHCLSCCQHHSYFFLLGSCLVHCFSWDGCQVVKTLLMSPWRKTYHALFFAPFCPLCALLLPYLHVSLVILMPSSSPYFAFINFMQNENKWRAFEMMCERCKYCNRRAQRGQKLGQTRNCKNAPKSKKSHDLVF